MNATLASILLLAVTSTALTGDEIARSKNGALTLSVLPEALVEKEIQGCSCSFTTDQASRGAGRPVLAWEFGAEENVPLQVNGQTRGLKVVSETNPAATEDHPELKTGDPAVFTLAGDQTDVVANCRATFTCADSEHDGCEVTRYQCNITVNANGASVAVPAAGECGC